MADQFREQGPFDELYDVPFTTAQTSTIEGGNAINTVPAECSFQFEFRNLADAGPRARSIARIDPYARETLAAENAAASTPAAAIEISKIASAPGLDSTEQAAITQLVRALTADQDKRKVAYGTEAGPLLARGHSEHRVRAGQHPAGAQGERVCVARSACRVRSVSRQVHPQHVGGRAVRLRVRKKHYALPVRAFAHAMSTATPRTPTTRSTATPIPTLDEIAEQHMALDAVGRAHARLRAARLSDARRHAPCTFKFELAAGERQRSRRAARSRTCSRSSNDERSAGVTCVSGGNHAVAVAYAAMRHGDQREGGDDPRGSNPARVRSRRHYRRGNRAGRRTPPKRSRSCAGSKPKKAASSCIRSTATGRCSAPPRSATNGPSQTPDLEAVILPIGGGGLAAGVATAMRLANPVDSRLRRRARSAPM